MTLVKGPMVIQTSHSVKHHRLKDWCMPTDFPQGYADAARCVDGWLPEAWQHRLQHLQRQRSIKVIRAWGPSRGGGERAGENIGRQVRTRGGRAIALDSRGRTGPRSSHGQWRQTLWCCCQRASRSVSLFPGRMPSRPV
jgi:hypothetical protein